AAIAHRVTPYSNQSIFPSHFVRMERFPLNINGNIDKKLLPKPDITKQAHNYEPAVGSDEESLENIWVSILGKKHIGRNISFFKTGGTSLKALQLISRIKKTFEVSITIAELFANPRIKELASLIA